MSRVVSAFLRWRATSRPRRALSGGVAALIAFPMAVLAARADGFQPERVEMSSGGAWLASPSQGLVTLIDGPSEQVVGSLRAPGTRAGDALSVTQSGSSAYLLNGTRGTVARVDGGTYEATPPIRFADAAGWLAVFASGPGVFVLDASRRTASLVDPVSLKVRQRLSLATAPGPGQSVVDDRGRLWVLDRSGGGLAWFDGGGGKHTRPDVGDARSRLVLIQGVPALVDVSRTRVGLLAGDGSVRSWSCLDVSADDAAELLGSSVAGRVYAAVSATGNLVSAGVHGDDCSLAVAVGKPQDRFGPLVEAAGFVLVPNRSTGHTFVVDVTGRRLAADLDLKVKHGSRIELLAKDGLVFYNDLDGDRAGVIRLDGGQWVLGQALRKFGRSKNGEAILTPAGEGAKAPATSSDQKPTSTSQPSSTGESTGPSQTDQPPPVSGPPPSTPAGDATGPTGPTTGPTGPTTGPTGPTTGPAGPTPPVSAPVIRSLTWLPATVVREHRVTFTATVDNAEGATWHWTILGAAGGAALHEASTVGTLTYTVPAGSPAALQVKLEVTGVAGSATPVSKPFTTTSSVAPQIQSLTATPASAGINEPVNFAAAEPVAGDRGTWTWTISGPGGTIGPILTPALQSLQNRFDAAGSYTVTLKVSYDGATDEKAVKVTVSDLCDLTASTASPVDVRAGARTVQVQLTRCFLPQTVSLQASGWLAVSDTSVPVQPGGSASVTVSATGTPPPVDGDNTAALTFGLANGRTVPYDVTGNRAPEWNNYTVCVPGTEVQFLSEYTDADAAKLTVTLDVGGNTYTMNEGGGTADPGLWGRHVPKSALTADHTWRVRATDEWGLSTPWASGTDQWNCW